jgi:hypothetical protein
MDIKDVKTKQDLYQALVELARSEADLSGDDSAHLRQFRDEVRELILYDDWFERAKKLQSKVIDFLSRS